VSRLFRRLRASPVALPLLAALLLVALSTCFSLHMYLNRQTDPLFWDLQINNYFAYHQDLVAAPIILAFLLIIGFVRLPGRFRPTWPWSNRGTVLAIAAAVSAATYLGTRLLFGAFGLSIDEFMADFDARILRSGALFGQVPPAMRPMVDALQPIWLFKTADGSLWSSSYLPGNAAIRALFSLIGDRALASPVLAAISVLLTHAVARKLEPADRGFAIVAVLLLVSSSQFLVTAMTPYAMTAHLALNLAWLWLVLDDRPASRAGALGVSFLACGLHQAIFHPLFALPFLPWLWLNGKRWQAAALYLVAIGGFTLFWLHYWTFALALVAPGASPAGLLKVPLIERIQALLDNATLASAWAHHRDNLLRLLTWQNPLTWVGVAAATIGIARLPRISWCLLGGVALTIAAMLLLMPAQGQGWGYRYLHGLLGNLALLGAYGWKRIAAASPDHQLRASQWLAASLAVSLLILLPLRLWQAQAFTWPWREADRRIAAVPADVVIIEHAGRWFAQDLVRNEPGLGNRPLRMLAGKLAPKDAAWVCGHFRVRVIGPTSPELAPLQELGLGNARKIAEQRIKQLRSVGCG
jgi:hypothetical protein